jgi:con80 domain of Katanin
MFSATNDVLRVWNLEENKVVDNVESSWRGVKDMSVFLDSDGNSSLIGLALTPSSFSVHITNLNYVNMDGKGPKVGLDGRSGMEEEKNEGRESYAQIHMSNNRVDLPAGIKSIETKSDPPARPLPALEVSQNPAMRSTIIPTDNMNVPLDVTLSNFITDASSKEKYQQIDMINDMNRDHTKFLDVLRARSGFLNPLIFYWNNNKLFSFMKAFEEQHDPMIIMDMINMIVTTDKMNAITIDSASIFTKKAGILIDSKYQVSSFTFLICLDSHQSRPGLCSNGFEAIQERKSLIFSFLDEEAGNYSCENRDVKQSCGLGKGRANQKI